MGSIIEHLINGKKVSGNGDRYLDVFNPATGEVSGQVAVPIIIGHEAPKVAVRLEEETAFLVIPPVVATVHNDVHFFDVVLANIRTIEFSRFSVK